MSSRQFFLGVDLGQAHDFSALAVVERVKIDSGEVERDYNQTLIRRVAGSAVVEYGTKPKLANAYHCLHLERLPTGTAYPAVVQRVRQVLATPLLRGGCELV